MRANPLADIPVLADDPVKNHPTRGEQLDILASVAAQWLKPGDAVIDLGIGTGYVARMIAARVPGLRIAGVDLKTESLAKARATLSPLAAELALIEGNLEELDRVRAPAWPYRVAVSVLTFHDLPDEAKRRAITWVAGGLAPGGVFLFMDRLRLDSPALFPAQLALWRRMERVYGYSMRRADDFAAYEADLGATNRPARASDYAAWFAEAGLKADLVHRHGNIALYAAAKA
ncbi:MAG: class I SAM-dependent methyltransferase [Alphaproteobacteria bacterium]|nr:class I SAM-dependent methyltransferase [Alphaproteobacteria bacterium]